MFLSISTSFFSLTIIFTFILGFLSISSLNTKDSNNFLLIGRDGAENRYGERADALILCSVNKKENEILLISIPRDSRVIIPCGPEGNVYDKIAHSLYYGSKKRNGLGETCVAKTVQNMFNISDLPYVSINFNGIRDIVNKINGVEITSPFSFCQEGKDGKRYCFAKNTKTKVSGDSFLAFVRHRKTFIRGDFDRTLNQRIALTALFDKIKDESTFDKIKLGIYSLTKVRTNLNLSEINKYAKLDLSNYNIKSIMLEGSDVNSSTYYYQINEKHLETLSALLNND